MSNGRKVGGFVNVYQDRSFQRTTCFVHFGSLKLNVLSKIAFVLRVYFSQQIFYWFQQINSSSSSPVPVYARLCSRHKKDEGVILRHEHSTIQGAKPFGDNWGQMRTPWGGPGGNFSSDHKLKGTWQGGGGQEIHVHMLSEAAQLASRQGAYAGVCSVAQSCPTPCNLMACQASLSMGFPRQEYWSGLPFPSPGNLPNLGIEPTYLALQGDS